MDLVGISKKVCMNCIKECHDSISPPKFLGYAVIYNYGKWRWLVRFSIRVKGGMIVMRECQIVVDDDMKLFNLIFCANKEKPYVMRFFFREEIPTECNKLVEQHCEVSKDDCDCYEQQFMFQANKKGKKKKASE